MVASVCLVFLLCDVLYSINHIDVGVPEELLKLVSSFTSME